MEQIERTPVHRSLVRPVLLGGAERVPAIINATAAIALGLGPGSIYTDDRARLLQTVSRNREKSTALEVLQSKLSPEFKSVSDRILHSVNRVQEMRR
jgi:type IV secretory pathway TrbD component